MRFFHAALAPAHVLTAVAIVTRIKKLVGIKGHRSLMEGTARTQNRSRRQTLFGYCE
jgi:hypothetical protein